MAQRPNITHTEEDGAHELRSERGSVTMRFDARTVGTAKASGFIGKAMVDAVLDVAERALTGRPPIDLFCDLSSVRGYDPVVRTLLTGWVRDNKDRLVSVNVLATNNIVNMGVTVANLRLSGFLYTWDDPNHFVAETRYRVVECQRGLPRAPRRT